MINRSPCPFCGESGEYGELQVVNVEVGLGKSPRQVWCETCGARGPAGDTDKEAMDKWNYWPYVG